MRIRTRTEGPCQVIAVDGSADVTNASELRQALLGAIEGGARRIICDLGCTDFVCSDALGVLITAYLKARARGGLVRLADPQEHLRDILKTTRLDHLFEVYPDVAAASARP